MMAAALQIEVPVFNRSALHIAAVEVAEDGLAIYEFPAYSIAGSATCRCIDSSSDGHEPCKTLVWRLSASAPSSLALQYLVLDGNQKNSETQLDFATPILPSISAISTGSGAQLALITADGMLHVFTAPAAHQLHRQLDKEDAHRAISLAAYFERTGAPTSLLHVGGYLCVGTEQGVVLCLPVGSYDPAAGFELKTGGGGFGLTSVLGGIFTKVAAQAVQQLVELNLAGKPLLCSIHEGSVFKLWDLTTHRQLHSQSLLPEPSATAYATRLARIAQEPVDASTHILAVHFHPKNAPLSSTDDDQLVVYEVFIEDRDGSYKVQVDAGPRLNSPLTGLVDLTLQPIGDRNIGAWMLFDNTEDVGSTLVCLPLAYEDGEIQPAATVQLIEEQLGRAVPATAMQGLVQGEAWKLLQREGVAAGTALKEGLQVQAVVDEILAPGQLSRHALKATLIEAGCDEATAGKALEYQLSDLRQHLPEWISESTTGDATKDPASTFFPLYTASWHRHHTPLALIPHTSPDGSTTLTILRSSGMLSMLRSATAPEAALQGLFPCVTGDHGGAGGGHPTLMSINQSNVLSAAAAVSAAAGGLPALQLAWAAVKVGANLNTVVLPALVRTVTAGAGQVHGGGEMAKLRSEWRAICRKLPLQLSSAFNIPRSGFAADLDTLLTTLTRYQGSSNAPLGAAGSAPLPHKLGSQSCSMSTAVATVAQVARAQVTILLQIELLCMYISSLHTLGGLVLEESEHQALVTRVLPKASELLQAASVAYWSATTPLTAPSSTSTSTAGAAGAAGPLALADPSQLVISLRIGEDVPGGSAAKRARLSPLDDVYVCEVLVPSHFDGTSAVPSGGGPSNVSAFEDLERLGVSFARWMLCMHGDGADADGDASMGVGNGDEGEGINPLLRTLPLAFELFRNRHAQPLAALLRLLCLLGEEHDARMLFFKACSKARSIKGASCQEERTQLEEESVALFFRAATIFSHPDFFGPQLTAIRDCVEALYKDTTQLNLPNEGEAAWELQYYETLMSMFERIGCASGASRFAHAAAQEVSRALPGDIRAEERGRREGRLWANVFAHNLEAKAYEEAYAALLSNQIPGLQIDCLHRLVNQLCADNQVEMLCRLPLAHTLLVVRHGKPVWVPLIDEATGALDRRAANLDLDEKPQPYKVLYAFHMSRHNVQSAAAAMLAYARRLQAERTGHKDSLLEAERALGVVVAALRLVDSEQAWLMDPACPGGAVLGRPAALTAGDVSIPAVLTLDDLSKEYATAKAHTAIARVMPGGEATSAATQDVLQQLLALNLHDEAFTLVHAVYCGIKLDQGRQEVIKALAEHCTVLQARAGQAASFENAVRSSQGGDANCSGGGSRALIRGGSDGEMTDVQGTEGDGMDAMDEGEDARFDSSEGGGFDLASTGAQHAAQHRTALAAAAWRRLESHLTRCESEATAGYRLRLAAVGAILAKEPRFCLPPWLISPFLPPVSRPPASVTAAAGQGSNAPPLSPRNAGDQQQQQGYRSAASADFAGLMRVYMQYGRLQDAAAVAINHLKALTQSVPSVAMARSGSVCYPHALLQELLARLESSQESGTRAVRQELQELLAQEKAAAARQTDVITQIYA